MTKYIDKDALVAEIERRIVDNKKDIERAFHKNLEDYFEGYEDALALLKQQYIDTLEVKEVDLEKEFDKCCENYIFDDEYDVYIARRFFELGMQVSNKAQKGE